MGKIHKDSKGFTVVELLLVIIIIILVGFVGWYVYHTDHKSTTTNTASNVSSSSNPYAGWKTYTATLESFSFKYPSDWTIDTAPGNTINTASAQSVMLLAPARSINGVQYQFDFSFSIVPPGPGDDTALPVYSSTKVTDSSFPQALYAVITEDNSPAGQYGHGEAGFINLYDTSYVSGSETDNNAILPSTNPGFVVSFGGCYIQVSDNTLSYFPPAEFASQQEVQQAIKIFGTLSQN
jgi:hypothetical protein